MMKANQLLPAAALASAIWAPTGTLAEDRGLVRQTTPAAVQLPTRGELPSLGGAHEWLNSRPLTAADLRGKVVLIDFWTYTCINWLRSLPYVRAWAERYKDQGLVVIGVHTPEFGFEREVDNVRRAAKDLGVDYPIAVDSGYAIWRAFENRYWPALYFFDAQERLRHHQFGEGAYEQSESVIQQLLAEVGVRSAARGSASVDTRGIEAAADWGSLKSPEAYLGYERAQNFVSPGGVLEDAPSLYRTASALPLNGWSLAGVWTIGGEFATLNDDSGRIVYRFHARDLHLVLAPSSQGRPVRFRVTIDGAPPGADHGLDVDAEGWGTVQEPRLYQLVRQTGPIADRTFGIEFFEAGVRVYAFTFG
jgi:thiol-disulfide isomerase/thioredoxin